MHLTSNRLNCDIQIRISTDCSHKLQTSVLGILRQWETTWFWQWGAPQNPNLRWRRKPYHDLSSFNSSACLWFLLHGTIFVWYPEELSKWLQRLHKFDKLKTHKINFSKIKIKLFSSFSDQILANTSQTLADKICKKAHLQLLVLHRRDQVARYCLSVMNFTSKAWRSVCRTSTVAFCINIFSYNSTMISQRKFIFFYQRISHHQTVEVQI